MYNIYRWLQSARNLLFDKDPKKHAAKLPAILSVLVDMFLLPSGSACNKCALLIDFGLQDWFHAWFLSEKKEMTEERQVEGSKTETNHGTNSARQAVQLYPEVISGYNPEIPKLWPFTKQWHMTLKSPFFGILFRCVTLTRCWTQHHQWRWWRFWKKTQWWGVLEEMFRLVTNPFACSYSLIGILQLGLFMLCLNFTIFIFAPPLPKTP